MDPNQDAFYQMLRIRMVEEAIAERYPEQEMRTPVHLCVGQEATPVGVSQSLRSSDKVLSGHRSHGHYLAKGGRLKTMIAEIYGKATGCSRGLGGSQHLVDLDCGFLGSAPILASTMSIGVGVAWSLKRSAAGDVCVVYFGDAAVEEGVFHEAASFASLHALPVIFVCENNLYSTHTKLDARQPFRPIADLAKAHAMAGCTIDGNNVEEVRSAAAEAVIRARSGGGPTLLVCDTYRWLEHVGPFSDIELGYRSDDELQTWIAKDPIERLRGLLNAMDSQWPSIEDEMQRTISEEIHSAFQFALESPFPDESELMKYVFCEGGPST